MEIISCKFMEAHINSDEDKQRVTILLGKFTLSALAFSVTALLLIVTLTFSFIAPDVFPQDQHFVIVPLLTLWLYLLRNSPLKLLQLRKDIRLGAISEINGLSIIHNKPGFKILFAPDVQLSVGNKSFALLSYPPENLHIGHQVSVKYFIHSQTLLSVRLSVCTETETEHQSLLNDIELAIVKLMVKGEPDKIIARQLSLEPATVRTYNTTIYRKLEVKNRKQAATKALETGLISVN